MTSLSFVASGRLVLQIEMKLNCETLTKKSDLSVGQWICNKNNEMNDRFDNAKSCSVICSHAD